jgi:hypothetical protein
MQVKLPEKENVVLRISPNPVRESIRMHIYSKTDADVRVSVYDGMGHLYTSFNTRVLQGSSFVTISDLQKWPNKVYTVQILVGRDRFTRKIVLVK